MAIAILVVFNISLSFDSQCVSILFGYLILHVFSTVRNCPQLKPSIDSCYVSDESCYQLIRTLLKCGTLASILTVFIRNVDFHTYNTKAYSMV